MTQGSRLLVGQSTGKPGLFLSCPWQGTELCPAGLEALGASLLHPQLPVLRLAWHITASSLTWQQASGFGLLPLGAPLLLLESLPSLASSWVELSTALSAVSSPRPFILHQPAL